MKLQLRRRGAIIRNQILFVLLSVVYLQVVREIAQGQSAINRGAFLLLVEQHQWLFILGFFTLVLTYYGKKLAKHFFVIYSISIIFLSIQAFLQSFDKIILVLNFIYILLSYYFYMFFTAELERALYHPGFVDNSIGAKCEYDLPVSLEYSKLKTTGHLSNWDEDSCFVFIDGDDKLPCGQVVLSIVFEGQTFTFQGVVRTRVGQGVGIKIESKKKEMFDWSDLYEIISNRGYRLRFT